MGACGGSEPSDQAETSQSTSQSTASEEPAAADAESAATVEITEFAYSPKQITVAVGDTVRWVNRDEFLHTVTSGEVDGPENKPDGVFDEDLAEAGSDATVTFDEPGTFTYFCSQHNAMDGVVVVQ